MKYIDINKLNKFWEILNSKSMYISSLYGNNLSERDIFVKRISALLKKGYILLNKEVISTNWYMNNGQPVKTRRSYIHYFKDIYYINTYDGAKIGFRDYTTMKAKLIHKLDNGRVKIYELSEFINTGISFGEKFNISEMLKKQFERFKKEYKDELRKYFTNDRGIKYIAISDAKTHIERLVFPAFPVNGKYNFLSVNIDGALTLMTQGGDASTIKPYEVYLRHLAMLNNLVYEGIVEEF